MFGTFVVILFLAVLIRIGMELFKGGIATATNGSASGCLIGIIGVVFGIAFLSEAASAPIKMIIVAGAIAAMLKDDLLD